MKNILQPIVLLVLLALLLFPVPVYAQGSGPESGKLIFGDNFTLESGKELTGGLVVFGGNVVIEKDAFVSGGVVVFGGTLTSNGDIEGDIVVIGGQVKLESESYVSGDVVTIGGQVERAEGAEIGGEVVNNAPAPEININPPSVPGAPDVNVPDVSVRFNPFWEFGKVLGVSLLMAFLALLVTLFFQDRLGRVSQAVVVQPLITGSIGLLVIVSLFVLAVTIVLIPFAVLGLIPLGLAWLFGVVAIGQEIGERLMRALRKDWAPAVTASLGTFILIFLLASIQSLSDLLPLLFCVTWIFPAAIGLLAIGAVVVTRFGAKPIQGQGMIVNHPPPASQP
jgi:cytoskeletal protein CcmA (bactofilin family)